MSVVNLLKQAAIKMVLNQRRKTQASDQSDITPSVLDEYEASALGENGASVLKENEASALEENEASVPEENPRRRFKSWLTVRPNERVRVVFLVLTPQIWPSMEPVWRKLSTDSRFNTKVVVAENNQPSNALSSLRGAYDLLTETGVPFVKASSFCMQSYKPHVVFYPLPYDSLYPDALKMSAAQETGARIAYIHYGLEVGGGATNARYQHDEPMLRIAWRIFARSKSQVKNFGKYCATGNAQVVLTGHPRADFKPDSTDQLPAEVMARAKKRKIILWAPHFSVSNRRKWSSFVENYETILTEIRKRDSIFFVLRPHPFLERTLWETDGWTPETVGNLFEKIGQMENVYIDRDTRYWPAFNSSDALMSDPGSFLVEYLLVDKPICLLESEDGIGLTQEVAAFTAFETGRTTKQICEFLDMVSEGKDKRSSDREQAREAYFGPAGADASGRIVEEILGGLSDRPFLNPEIKQSEKHLSAINYWKSCTNTFLAPEEYYERQEIILTKVLDHIQPKGFALDIGCGNGRYTELFSRYLTFVEGIDPSYNLILQAQQSALEKGIDNIEYREENLETPVLTSTYDLVSCMGVLSGVIDNEKFLQASHWLRAATKPRGHLILKESLSKGREQTVDQSGYVAVYRNIRDYIDVFNSAGFELIETITIAPVNEKGLTNCLFIFVARDW